MGEDHAVSRRRFVEGTGLTTLAALAGCTGGDTENNTPTSSGETDAATDASNLGSTPEATSPPEGGDGTPTESEGEAKDVPRNFPGQTVDNPVLRPIDQDGQIWPNLVKARIPSAEYVSDGEVGFDYEEYDNVHGFTNKELAEEIGYAIASYSHTNDDWAWQHIADDPTIEKMNQHYEDPVFWMLWNGNEQGPVWGDLRTHTADSNKDTVINEFDISSDTLKGLLEGGSGSVEKKGDRIYVHDQMSMYGKEFPIVAGMLDGQSQVVGALEAPLEGKLDSGGGSELGGTFRYNEGENARNFVDVGLGIVEGQADPTKSSTALETIGNIVEEKRESAELGTPLQVRLSPRAKDGQAYLEINMTTMAGDNYGGGFYRVLTSGETRTVSESKEGWPSPAERVGVGNRYSA
jgi:hypothetical protein